MALQPKSFRLTDEVLRKLTELSVLTKQNHTEVVADAIRRMHEVETQKKRKLDLMFKTLIG